MTYYDRFVFSNVADDCLDISYQVVHQVMLSTQWFIATFGFC
jgi:hypothetical protein